MSENNHSNSQEIYQILLKRIISTEYPPGHMLNESDIAKEFNISRTPVREALKQLENENFIILLPRVGVQVSPLDFKYLKSIFDMKKVLDGFAARLCAKRSHNGKEYIAKLEDLITKMRECYENGNEHKIIEYDSMFHQITRKMSNNKVLEETLNHLHGHLERLWNIQEQELYDTKVLVDTLSNILDAIKAHDEEAAAEAASIHMDAYLDQVKSSLL